MIELFSGHFIHGLLNGKATIVLQDSRRLYGSFYNGMLHGPVVIKGTVPILPVSNNSTSISL